MARRNTFRLGLLVVVAFCTIDTSRAQQVIGSEVDPAAFGINTAREAHHKRVRFARVNPAAFDNSAVSLNLFGDAEFTSVERRRGRQLDSETWVGSVEGEALGTVTFSRHSSGIIFGKVETESATYLIQHKAGPVYAIIELDRNQMVDESEAGDADGVELPGGGGHESLGKLEAASVCLASTTCASQSIDVMVVYTGQARSVLGGSDAAAQAAIANAIAEMNTANLNSGVTHTFNLVHAALVSYAESNNASTDLSRLSGTSDGYMDEIHAWRTAYGADLVSLITDTGGCGIGYVQSNPENYNSNAAFNTVRNDCLTGNKTLAHEIGHNSGLHHDWGVNSSSTPCLWNHGYVNQAAFGSSTSQRWRTIMAYNTQCSDSGFNCSRLTYWSNPNKTYTSDPMGIPQGQSTPSDAAFALNRGYCQVADFRASATPQAPTANFVGSPISGDYPLQVSFSDQSIGSPTSWAWTFGDGSSSSQQNPTYTFTAAGSFTVSLSVSNSEGSDGETKTSYILVTVPEPPPANPTGLVATASSPSTIDVTWTDNASNEDGYKVERSPNGLSGWSQVADLGVGATSFNNTELLEGTTYYYRAFAYHSSAQSGYSNVDDAETPVNPVVDHVASSQSVQYGTVNGGFSNTHSNERGMQTITEDENNGKPSRRTSRAEITWTFPVRVGFPATFHANAWFAASSDDDEFRFSYSDDGSSFVDLFAADESNSDPGSYQAGFLGLTTSSTMWIRLEDTNRDQGNRSLDQVSVDHMYIRTEASSDPPPAAPVAAAGSAGSSQIDLSWADVADELGYRVDRSTTSGGPAEESFVVPQNSTGYSDTGLSASTTYYYKVVAYNAGGSSASNEVSATTDGAPTTPELHLGDLVTSVSGKKRWTLTVRAPAHNDGEGDESEAVISGNWSTGGTGSCTTDGSGECEIKKSFKSNVPSVTFTVTSITKVGFVYNPLANHGSNIAAGSAPDRLAKGDLSTAIPETFAVNQNYPNPFNPATILEFGLPDEQHVAVVVYNALGREVARLHDGVASAGWHRVTFDGSGLSTGTYVAVVRSDGVVLTRVMLLAK